MAGPVIVKLLEAKQEFTAEDLNEIFQALADRFGAIDGSDFLYPLVMQGDINLSGNRLLRAREVMQVLDISEYGSDDQAFQTAVSELSAGGMVFIPKNTTITLSRGVKIRQNRNRLMIAGTGYSSVLKLADNADDHAISVDGCFRFRISNLRIDGNRANNAGGHGIWINESSEFEISNVWVGSSSDTGASGYGIFITDSKNFGVKRCWIRNPVNSGLRVDDGSEGFTISQVYVSMLNNGVDDDGVTRGRNGIVVQDSRDGVVDSCRAEDITTHGIAVVASQNVGVVYSTVRRCFSGNLPWGLAGIFVGGRSEEERTSVRVFGNVSTENERGIEVGVFVDGQIMCNYVRGNAERPLNIPAPERSVQMTLRDNNCMDVKNHGKITFLSGASTTNLDLGVSNLPIQAVVATWNWDGATTVIKSSVLGVRYSGQTLTFYNASPIGSAADIYYSIEV